MLRVANARAWGSALAPALQSSRRQPQVLARRLNALTLIRSYREERSPRLDRDARSPRFDRDARSPRFDRDARGPRFDARGTRPGAAGRPRNRSSSGRNGPMWADASETIHEGATAKRTDYITRFEDLAVDGKVQQVLVSTLTQSMGLETMTPVQSQTITELLDGDDVTAQARTGTGKTLAFLIPIMQKILAENPKLAQPPRREVFQPDVKALIISPTRELAEQIAAEATRLKRGTSIRVQTAVGGTQKSLGLRKIMYEGCHVLVGTPGRLKDILSDRFSGIKLDSLNAFVLDEADRLLDDGFLPDIKELAALLPPKQERQNMMFSATVPREILQLSRELQNPNSRFIQTIQPGEVQTHQKIPQKLVRLKGMANALPALLELMDREIHREGANTFKAIVFCNSTAETMLYAEAFAELKYAHTPGEPAESFDKKCQVLEIHSRLTQRQRSDASAIFKKVECGVLFSSDVSARGMDYPNVTHVIQMGMPRDRDYYIHRLGRTGRADKQGEGWLIADNFDAREVPLKLAKLPIQDDTSLKSATAELEDENQLTPEVKNIFEATRQSMQRAPFSLKLDAYKSIFSCMNHVRHKQALVDEVNDRALIGWGMDKLPELDSSFASKIGVSRCKGMNLKASSRGYDDSSTRQSGPGRPGYRSYDLSEFSRSDKSRGKSRFARQMA